MKSLYLLLISCGTALSALAQTTPTLTIQVNGNRNSQLMVDGKLYTLSNTSGTAKHDPVTITTLKPGSHTLQFVRTNQNKTTTKNTKKVSIRSGYDLLVTINGDGSVQTKESKSIDNTSVQAGGAMSDAAFTSLLQSVRNQWRASARMTAVKNAFANKNNFFTTDQAGQLISLVTGENNRLQLAKASYRSITDPANFTDINELFTSNASKESLAAYVGSYNGENSYTSVDNNQAKVSMTDARFNTLLRNVKNQWKASTKVSLITNAFNDKANYFTTDQVGQLIGLVPTESDRLQLAKLSYRGIVDTSRFADINELLNTQASRDDLANYVYRYNGGTGNIISNNAYRTPMAEANFNALYRDIQGQWMPFAKMSALTSAFANDDNYFTTSQARQLIMLVSDQDNRLQLAKSAYRNITDPANFSQLYDVLNTQALRDELDNYVRTYKR